MLVCSNIFIFMFKYFIQSWIISPLPDRWPRHRKHFIFVNQIFMDILEVKDICSILWDILHMAHDIVNSLSSILIFGNPLLIIKHCKIWLYCRIWMNPYINKSIYLFSDEFSLFWTLSFLNPLNFFRLFASKIFIIF